MKNVNPYHIQTVLDLGIPTADFENWLENEASIPFSLFTSMYSNTYASS
jgi:hypothetical protein